MTERTSGPRGAAAPWLVVTGLDGAGKTTLVEGLAAAHRARRFRLPYHDFVKAMLERSGDGSALGDVHTDRLLFAADARLANSLIRRWRGAGRPIVSQRGWMDNFIFGAAQGVSYEQTDALLRTAELERPSAAIYLVADPEVAYARIRRDPPCDKFETLAFMRVQYEQTLHFYRRVAAGLPPLEPFAGIPTVLIDTTRLSVAEVFDAAQAFLRARAGLGL